MRSTSLKSLRLFWLPALLLAAVTLASCKTAPYVWVQHLPAEPKVVKDGTIGSGDLLEILVFGQESLTTRARVRADGTVTMPLLGEISVAGQQPANVAMSLRERLKPFVNNPNVTVVIQQSVVSVTALGELRAVGQLELQAPATVLQAIGKAGGLTTFADRDSIFVLRAVSGVTRRIRFKYEALIAGDAVSNGFHLKSGDVLVVE